MTRINIIKRCPLCGQDSIVEGVDESKYERFVHGRATGEPVAISGAQTLFPELSADDREILISGTHGECFDRAFGGDE